MKSISKEEIEKILQNTDWQKFWDTVSENCQKEIEAYRVAEAKSRAVAHLHWFI